VKHEDVVEVYVRVRPVAAGTSPIIPELRIIRSGGEGEQRATFFELFFDLVYVFAVTQLSHHLLAEISWAGAAETAFMLVALYWARGTTPRLSEQGARALDRARLARNV
jgi:hypothetical protein